MKKSLLKHLFIISITSMLLIGCNGSSSQADQVSLSETSTPTIEVENNNNSNISTQDETLSPKRTFEISSHEIARTVYGKDVDSFSEQIDGYNIDVFPNEDYLLFCVTSEGDDFPMLIYIYDQMYKGTTKYSASLIETFLASIPENSNIQIGTYRLDNSGVAVCAWIENSDALNFPVTVQIVPNTDYFLFTNIEEYNLACSEGRYDDIYYDVTTYIDNTNPPSYDNAYRIQSTLSPIMDDWENIEVQYDAIEKHATFFYSGVTTINSTTHFIPYATTNERNVYSLIGFYDSDWLFFEDIIISSNENIKIPVSDKKIEDVTNNGNIYEAYNCSLDNEILEELLSSSDHTIRFVARDDTYKDFEMSNNEYEALICISKFYNVRNILSNLLFHFQERMS